MSKMKHLCPILGLTLMVITSILSTSLKAAEQRATFAGGCFWCMEYAFEEVEGIISTRVGFIGGATENPTYYQVSRGKTGHTEAVEVVFESDKINYQQLLQLFWRNIDPLDGDGQFCDRGDQYRPGIFFHNQEQRQQAEVSRQGLTNSQH
ncbi:MAG: peptide-methionine (S)-S-oxide reductase MsrA, partial [Motiliproteus sp.]|nr:peptide-methionine (S)-S-oxide reductase MsrA [Motiliproteus sp.]